MADRSDRSQRLAKYFGAVLYGKKEILSAADAKRFFEAIRDQQSASTAVERLIASPVALKGLRQGLRFNASLEFINQQTSPLIEYFLCPEVKRLCNGQFLYQLLEIFIEPRTLWAAYLRALEVDGALNERATTVLLCMVLELLSSCPPGDQAIDITSDIQSIMESTSVRLSPSQKIRDLATSIKQVLGVKVTKTPTDSSGTAPGGRHDNDFVDFRKVALFPTSEEFLSTEKPFYRQATEVENVEPEHRIAAHLDNQFRLSREDMLSELREDLQVALGQKKGRRPAFILKKLSLIGVSCCKVMRQKTYKPCTFRISCGSGLDIFKGNPSQEERKKLWKENRTLKNQSFGCLIRGQEIVSFATVDRNVDDLALETPVVSLKISGKESRMKALSYFKRFNDLQFILVDTPIFAYEPILRCLQGKMDLPLSQEILFHTPASPVEGSNLIPKSFLEELEDKGISNIQDILGTQRSVTLDYSQLDSLLAGLKQNLSLIQGPPGTGKSFIGALLSKAIHDRTTETILVLCYTNHALDQFLEDLLDIGIDSSNIVRLGSKSTPRTASLSLAQQSYSHNRARSTSDVIRSLESEAGSLEDSVEDALKKYQAFSITGASILDLLEFEAPDFYEALALPEPEDGMILVGKDGKPVKADYLLNLWTQGHPHPGSAFEGDASKESEFLWALDEKTRSTYLQKWTENLLREQIESFEAHISSFNQCQAKLDKVRNKRAREILKSKRVIGCTTTAAAMHAEELGNVSPGVVLLEEAGEILESHVLTALGPETKQLILIGDHQQLRPKVNKYELTVEKGAGYNLNRSLFERLVLGGYPHTVLTKQHRMCGEISAFVRELSYPELEDGPGTMDRPQPRGLQDRVIFFNHEHPEMDFTGISDRRDEGAKSSKRNLYEVEMILKIVKYLGQQGYGTDKLVVLTPYLGQLHLLRHMLQKENDPVLNDLDTHDLVKAGLVSQSSASLSKREIKISTIDNYQGEESEIVIATLTRSNQAGEIGFMSSPQRLNVLLSRARDVLIMVGNAKTFLTSKKGRTTWLPFINRLTKNGHVYDGLPVKCEQHPSVTAVLNTPGEFQTECPDGGCPAPWVCNEEDRAKEIKQQRDLQLDAERQRKQTEYARQLAVIQDEIAQRRRIQRDELEKQERERVLQQQREDLARLKASAANAAANTTSNANPVQANINNTVDQNSSTAPLSQPPTITTTSTTNPSIPPTVPTEKTTTPRSSAKDDWEYEKQYLGAQSPEIDALMPMIGLEDVKQKFLAIKSQVDTAIRQNADLKSERFGSVLLGNPGTGKTTVARIYAKFLASVGVLPGSHIIETTGSRLANDGVTGCKKTLEAILNAGGGALFIDEAYQLVQNSGSGGTQVLDFLLAEVENLTGQLVIILAGYQRQMEPFFAHNPGLPSRFPHELKFADHDDNELLRLLEYGINKRYRGKMKVEGGFGGLYCRIVARRIGRGRGQDGFGNARAVENTRSRICEQQANRLRQARRAQNRPRKGSASLDDLLLTKEDLIGPEPSTAVANSSAWQKMQKMIGLNSVKKTIQALLDSMQFNYQRELEEKPLVEFTLNKVFLGSPGTGKTTIAKLYGQILVDMGLLTNGEVIVKNPSDFVGSVIGESEKNTKGILASTVGKVLVIDEAYGLFGGGSKTSGSGPQTDIYKTAVLDTIVAEVQSTPGDNRCVLLLGYKDQMEEMFQNVNPGLSRRFPLDSAFVFEDFSPDEMERILDLKLTEQGFGTNPQGRKVALEVLERARNKPNFGNAGEIDILLNSAKLRFQRRLASSRQGAQGGRKSSPSSIFEPQDFDSDFDRADRAETNIAQLFSGVVGCETVVEKLEGYRRTVKSLRQLEMDPRDIPFNFLLRGPPGTGKTTTARKIGKVYYDMGLLSTAEVVECSVTNLVGQYVGQTGPKTQAMFEKALGKILFIDEAYRLAEGQFAKEAMDEIVDCITKPRFARKLIIILAGYDADINRLMTINPGLTSRFPESLQFQPLSPSDCVGLLINVLQAQKKKLASKRKVLDLSALEQAGASGLLDGLKQGFDRLSQTSGWANGRDVETLARSIFNKAIGSLGVGKNVTISEELVRACLTDMIQERVYRKAAMNPSSQNVPTSAPAAAPQMNNSPPPTNATTTTSSPAALKNHSLNSQPDQGSPPPLSAPVEGASEQRDAGVPDDTWNQLQQDKSKAEQEEDKYKQMLQDESNGKAKLAALQKGEVPDKPADNEEEKKRHEQRRLERKLVRRRQEEELERIRKQREKEEKRRECERQAQKKLRELGVCCQGFRWIKQPGGYRCAGGSHYVSDAQIGL